MFNGKNLSHELLLTTRQKTKLRNAFENNNTTDIKLRKAQITKIIQSGGFLGPLLSKIAGLFSSCSIGKKYSSSTRNNCCSSAIDAGIQKKVHDTGTNLII